MLAVRGRLSDGHLKRLLCLPHVGNDLALAVRMHDVALSQGLDLLHVPRSDIPAVTHVDYSARIQTVEKHVNARYHGLLSAFERKTGCPVLVNTSFNVRGEPIVCTPEDAYLCFMRTGMDALVLEDMVLLQKGSRLSIQPVTRAEYDIVVRLGRRAKR